jgi:hypothetical protein
MAAKVRFSKKTKTLATSQFQLRIWIEQQFHKRWAKQKMLVGKEVRQPKKGSNIRQF